METNPFIRPCFLLKFRVKEMNMNFKERLANGPKIDDTAFVAPTAAVLGDVVMEKDSSVWYHCVLRGDDNQIVIGPRTNVQDLVMMHGEVNENGSFPVLIGADVTIGHSAIIHGCEIGDRVLVGMGAVILTGAKIGEGSIIAAGSVVREYMVVPPRSLVVGVPGKVKKELSPDQEDRIAATAGVYLKHAAHYRGLNREELLALHGES
jgi:carbonic anhydrase/acetyltransferase-like protein (isoleucine patch superfamily)